MTARFFSASALPHRRILVAIYLSMAALLLGEIAFYWTESVANLAAYLQSGGLAGYAATGVVYTTPFSCLALAWLVRQRSRSPWMLLPVAHTFFAFPAAVVPAIYLLWWCWRQQPASRDA